jgi:hypothetical protein
MVEMPTLKPYILQNLVKIDKIVSEICVILKKASGRGWG